jgi:hypothetical protein
MDTPNNNLDALRAALLEGEASGIAEDKVFDRLLASLHQAPENEQDVQDQGSGGGKATAPNEPNGRGTKARKVG